VLDFWLQFAEPGGPGQDVAGGEAALTAQETVEESADIVHLLFDRSHGTSWSNACSAARFAGRVIAP
jgi:hypothetical protein